MADVWLARYSRWLEKLVGAKGGPVVVDVNPSLTAVISTQSTVDELYLQAVYRFANFIGVAAAAALQAGVQLRNPVGSGVVAVIELIGIGPAVATTSTFHVSQNVSTAGGADFATQVKRGFRLDPRGNQQSTCILSGGSELAAADLLNITFLSSGNNTVSSGIINATQGLWVPLLPGDTIRVVDQTLNEAFSVEMAWRERALESSELT